VLGAAVGFLIVKSKIAWRKTLMDQLFLKNTRFMRTFLASVAVGTIVFYFFNKWGLVDFHARPTFFWGAVGGGLLAAAGLTLCGQIPSSTIAAIASGRLYALWVLVGMLLAMPVANAFSRWFADSIGKWRDPLNCQPTIESAFPNGGVFWIAGIALAACLFLEFATPDKEEE
jgi:hypothetical protein